jgi:hypothetical protein
VIKGGAFEGGQIPKPAPRQEPNEHRQQLLSRERRRIFRVGGV